MRNHFFSAILKLCTVWKKSEMTSDRSLDFPGKLHSQIEEFEMRFKKSHSVRLISIHSFKMIIIKNTCFLHRVEDHDDLTPIFNRQSDVLTSTYGMYLKLKLTACL